MKLISIIAASILLFGTMASASAKPIKASGPSVEQKTTVMYFLFPWVLSDWGDAVRGGGSGDRQQQEKILSGCARYMGIQLNPKPSSVSNTDTGKAMMRYLMSAAGNADAYNERTRKNALYLGLPCCSAQRLLRRGALKSSTLEAKDQKELESLFGQAIKAAKELGLPKPLISSLTSIRDGSRSCTSNYKFAKLNLALTEWQGKVIDTLLGKKK